jgi:hypothetical protein
MPEIAVVLANVSEDISLVKEASKSIIDSARDSSAVFNVVNV